MLPQLFLFWLVFYIVRAFSRRYLHLNDIPGPALAAWSRLWMVRTLASGDSAAKYQKVNKRYGELPLLSLKV